MDPGTPEAKDLIHTLISHHVAITSTLPVFEGDLGGGRPPLRQQAPEAMTPQAREDFFLLRQRPASAPAPSSTPKIDPALLWKHDLDMEHAFVGAGGLLLAGPDPWAEATYFRDLEISVRLNYWSKPDSRQSRRLKSPLRTAPFTWAGTNRLVLSPPGRTQT